MNLDQIATKCFILALFIRDDGQRLLLGDGYYDFNQKLQHFQGNTIANDIVEIQGDNGQLLAGQVMRSGAQKFEGYIGDATTSRQLIEQKRSDFMAFFRIKHFYKVVYIFPDGTAIQRQRGYLTDAPTIPEIFQKFPEYSVALNFEDANYYEYAEDEHGDEIYAHIIELALSGNATGGLVWDAIGAVSNGISWSGIQTAQGEYIQITNELDIPAKLASVEMLGKATQNGTPSPDSPQPISVVTGENVVKIEGKNLLNTNARGLTLPYTATERGVAFTINTDGSVSVNGQNDGTGNSALYLYNSSHKLSLKSGQYTGSLNANDEQITGLTLTIYDGSSYKNLTNATQTLSGECLVYLQIVRNNPTVFTNYKVYPQLEIGSQASDYEPYQGQEFEVNLGKNLLDPTATLQGVWNNASNGTTCTFFMPIYNGETYTISNQDTATWRFSAGLTTNPTNNPAGTGSQISAWQTGASYTIAAQSNGYLWVQLRKNANTAITPSDIPADVFMIERGSQATSFAPYFPPIELAKIGTYQDRIYKNDGKWYVEKQIGKVVLNGSENWWGINQARWSFYLNIADKDVGTLNLMVNTYTVNSSSGQDQSAENNFSSRGTTYDGTIYLFTPKTTISGDNTSEAVSNFKTWLGTHNTTVYYALATPTTTEITNEALIAQLEALGASSLYVGLNNIGTETLNAVPTLKIEYYTEVDLDGAGYEWEPGGNTAKTIVTVAGVDSAWPIWTVQGGAQNPTLTNITTGQTITWQGFVPEGQTLTINMAEMTADLAGANVFEYITGEWIRLAPGNNTLVYTAGSADKPSTLSWNGVLA